MTVENLRVGGEGAHFDKLARAAEAERVAYEYAQDYFDRELNARGPFGRIPKPASEIAEMTTVASMTFDALSGRDCDQIMHMMISVIEAASRGVCMKVEARKCLDLIRDDYARSCP